MKNSRLPLEISSCERNDLEKYYCKDCNFETDLVQMPSTGIVVINANLKRNIRATLKIITQFISQQMQSSGIIVMNANTKRNLTNTLNDIRKFISQQMLSSGIAVINANTKRYMRTT
ncbi:hypothetical protein MTP99_015899 [Tenebrio molitor]|nr:hypothetical protein MTP99_015899 [Tenebrio molitor]